MSFFKLIGLRRHGPAFFAPRIQTAGSVFRKGNPFVLRRFVGLRATQVKDFRLSFLQLRPAKVQQDGRLSLEKESFVLTYFPLAMPYERH